MLRNRSADKVFDLEGNTDASEKARTHAALRGLRSAMSYNGTTSTGESLHLPYHPKGLMYKWYALQLRKGGRQTGCRQSDDCIVPKKAGNAARGKAVMQSHIKGET